VPARNVPAGETRIIQRLWQKKQAPKAQSKVSVGDLRQVIFRRDFKLRGAEDAFPAKRA
jgi:hypothetical protein